MIEATQRDVDRAIAELEGEADDEREEESRLYYQ